MSTQETMDPSETLLPKQLRAIELLAQGLKMEEVAGQVGVCARTIQNWKQDKPFATRLHERFSYVRDDIQAAFNPILERIVSRADKFLDRAFKMMDSEDDKIAKVGMQFYLQSLKWAGSRENRGRGADIGIDGMVGRYQGYGKPENTGNMSRLFKMLRGFHPDTPDEEVGAETEGARGQGPGVSEEQVDPETGKNRKAAEGETVQPETPAVPISRSPSTERGPGGEVMSATAPPKPEKSGKQKPWQNKAPNHVPFYRKFQRR
jgi:hypothetical protein